MPSIIDMSETNLVFHIYNNQIIQRPVQSRHVTGQKWNRYLPDVSVGRSVAFYKVASEDPYNGRSIEKDIFDNLEDAIKEVTQRKEEDRERLKSEIKDLQEELKNLDVKEIEIKLYEDILKETANKEIRRLCKENKLKVSF